MRKEPIETIEKKILCSKKEYDSIEIPEELRHTVNGAVAAGTGQRMCGKMKRRRKTGTLAAAAAALLICFTAGLNTSPAFAAVMSEVPVLGAVSKVLTFRTYDYQDQDKIIHAAIPQLQEAENAEAEERGLEQRINEEINTIMNQYEEDAERRVVEYKEAFLATGGTPEEFAEKGIRVDAGYEVYFESDDRLSFAILADENWCSAYGLRIYYNLDLDSGRQLTLKDLLGEDYTEICNRAVKEQMKENMEKDENLIYWDKDMGGFTTVDEATDFYINAAGRPVVVFDKYEIAPGAFGIQEFEIR